MTSCRISLELTNTGVGTTRMWNREGSDCNGAIGYGNT